MARVPRTVLLVFALLYCYRLQSHNSEEAFVRRLYVTLFWGCNCEVCVCRKGGGAGKITFVLRERRGNAALLCSALVLFLPMSEKR